jgi:hypothetical protein
LLTWIGAYQPLLFSFIHSFFFFLTEAEARRFVGEWGEVRAVLGRLPVSDQRALLGQLIIVANGQTQTIRVKLVENVIVRLQDLFSKRTLTNSTGGSTKDSTKGNTTDDDDDEMEVIIDHVREFARLRHDQRRLFGKVLFSTLSQLHLESMPNKQPKQSKQQQKKKSQGAPDKPAVVPPQQVPA